MRSLVFPYTAALSNKRKTNIYLQAVAIQNLEVEYSALLLICLLPCLLPKHNLSNMKKQYIPLTCR